MAADPDPDPDLDPDPRRPRRRRADARSALVLGTVATVVAVVAAVGAGLVAGALDDGGDRDLGAPEAEIRFTAEDDESASDQPLLAEDRSGTPAPDDPFTLLDGGLATFSDFAGTPTVVNFFASWCEPCRAELPDFATLDAEMPDDVVFLGVNLRDREQDARALMDETGASFPVARDPSGTLAEAFGVVNMPSTFFLDGDGMIVSSHAGVLDADALRAEIERLR